MSRFPTAAHLASWAGMRAGNNITGGKRQSGKTTKGDRVARATSSPNARGRGPDPRHLPRQPSSGGSPAGSARRRPPSPSATRSSSSAGTCSPNDCDYDDLGGDYFTRRTNPDRHRDRLIEQLHDLGYQVTLRPVA